MSTASNSPSPGDFNGDGLLDAVDIDRLSMEIRTAGGDLAFDLNDDVLVNAEDRRLWVKELRNTYFGDTDLDGAFNSSDMIQVFVKGKYETGEVAGWVEGDWDGNGFFDSSDMITAFVDGGYEKGPQTEAFAVPEPTSALLLIAGFTGVIVRWRRLRR